MAVPRTHVLPPASPSFPAAWLLVLLLLAGCDTQDRQDEFAADASLPPSGFTETTPEGKVVTEDADDWRTAPAYFGAVRVEPAFPNPAAVGDLISIPVTILPSDRAPGRLSLRAVRNDDFFNVERIEPQGTGLYSFTFPTETLPRRGLQRVFLFDELTGELVSYGDIMVE